MIEKYLISESEIKQNQVQGNLADRPSQVTKYGGRAMTPEEVKAMYDKLPKLIAKKLNNFLNAVPETLAEMILTGIRKNHSLKDLFEELKNGTFMQAELEKAVADLFDRLLEEILRREEMHGKDGKTPYIGINGNWWLGEYDTGTKASGKDGSTPYIGVNGNWWLNGIDTGVKASGKNGKSAYEIALENGFVGSESEWLDSLKAKNDLFEQISSNDEGKLLGVKNGKASWMDIEDELPTLDSDDNGKVLTAENGRWVAKENTGGVSSINGKRGEVTMNASDVGADEKGAADGAVSSHNTSNSAHSDIRMLLQELTERVTAILQCDDETLDEWRELVDYIKANRTIIESITVTKVNVSDIIDNLTSNVTNKPLSAKQGVALKALIDAITVPTKTSQLSNDSGFLTQHQDLSSYAKKTDIPTVPTKVGQLENDKGYMTEENLNSKVDGLKAEVTPVKGVDYNDGLNGSDGIDGKDYVLTSADKAEIADKVDGATIVQAPKYVNSVDEMTDTGRVYVMASTGKVWAYMDTSVEQDVTVTDNIVATADNGYKDGNRFGSSGDGFSNDASGYHITPLIDLTKAEYQGKTIQLHLEGAQYSSTGAYAQWIQSRTYGLDKAALEARPYTCDTNLSGSGLADTKNGTMSVTYNSATSTTVTIQVPPTYGSAKTKIGYLRFCGKGAVADSKIYITYQSRQMVAGGQWVDTGTLYAPALTSQDISDIAEQAAAIVDENLLSLIGSGVVST